jgi:hypothetical protein
MVKAERSAKDEDGKVAAYLWLWRKGYCLHMVIAERLLPTYGYGGKVAAYLWLWRKGCCLPMVMAEKLLPTYGYGGKVAA